MTFQEKRELARSFIKCYLAAREGLTRLGILRSERTLQADYAEWLVAGLLGLELASSGTQRGWDAIDPQGKTYQIKSRIVGNLDKNTSFDITTIDRPFDYLIGVFFSPELELLGVIRVPYDVVRELGSQNRNSFRFRWNKRIANDERIEKIVWPPESMD
ncbi:hypothetical protein HRbin22_01745 [Candidatus Thermoflexus japonica]|uniref:Uncharacterized protein n=1 Tax=Candidatus Thermoflexus japonica TaxID=2035417 RepID=A0A2H5Y7S1_9CHLR|nr:hypothetical protein HRbin22_01745 [Candidatus Thermoflexus japonica]